MLYNLNDELQKYQKKINEIKEFKRMNLVTEKNSTKSKNSNLYVTEHDDIDEYVDTSTKKAIKFESEYMKIVLIRKEKERIE